MIYKYLKIIKSKLHNIKDRLSNTFSTKEIAASKFFIQLFTGKTRSEVDDYIFELWSKYRRWNEICAITNLQPNNNKIYTIDVGGGLTSILSIFRTPYKWVVDICTDELRKSGLTLSPGLHYIRGIAEAIPFPDQFFDYIFCTNALDHFEDPEKSLKEFQRILKNKGYCIIAVDVFPYAKGYRNILHPHSFTFESVKKLLNKHFHILKNLTQPEGGKVGFGQLVHGNTTPQKRKEEIIFILQKI